MRDDNVITLKDLFEAQQRGFTELRDMLNDHDKRTVLLAYRTDKLEQALPPMEESIEDLQNARKHYAKVAGYIAAFATVIASAAGFLLQNMDAVAKVIK